MIRTFTFATIQYLTWADLPDNLRVGLTEGTASGWYYVPGQTDSNSVDHSAVVSFDTSNVDHRAARRLLDDSLPNSGDDAISNNQALVLQVDGAPVVSEYFISTSFKNDNFAFQNFNSGDQKSTIIFEEGLKLKSVSRAQTTLTDLFGNPLPSDVMLTITIINDEDDEIAIIVYGADADYQYRYGVEGELLSDSQFQETYASGNNVAPVFASSTYIFNLDENADGSSTAIVIGTVSASDEEDDAITYSLNAEATAAGFAIASDSGAITYTGTGYDYEAFDGRQEVQLVVTATTSVDDDSDPLTANLVQATTATVTVQIRDLEEPIVVSLSGAITPIQVAEDVAGGTILSNLQIVVDDPDKVVINEVGSFVVKENDVVSDKFEIVENLDGTFSIALKSDATLDYETAQQHSLTIEESEPGRLDGGTVSVTIQVTNVADVAPIFPSAVPSSATIEENTAFSQSFAATPDVTGDTTPSGVDII